MSERVPTDDLLDELRRLAEDLGRTPTQKDVKERGEYGKNTYVRRFGSYTAACEAAGLEPNGSHYEARYHIQRALGDVVGGVEPSAEFESP